jgi:hypothetical protein
LLGNADSVRFSALTGGRLLEQPDREGVTVKFTGKTVKTALGAAGIAAVSVFGAATASASPIVQGLGTSETLIDGPLITAYTVSNLQPTNVTVPGYRPTGQLWQADVNAMANSGVITPVVSDFNARTGNNQTYRVISASPTPDALSPAPIPQGGQANGKIYFDVTGAPPTSVVYNDGVQDVLVWTVSPAPNPAPAQVPSPAPNAPTHS